MRSCGWLAISAPWSQVSDRRSWAGRVVMVAASASRTASAPCPASAGPFFALGPVPWPCMGGRCSSIVNRVVRSARVPIAELFSPMMRSPSQCPGTARSSASAGRSLIMISGRGAQRPAGAQARGELAAKGPAALDVQGLVDRLVRDPHGIIIGEVRPQPVRDLLRAPRGRPAPVLAAPVTPTDPADVRAFRPGPILGPPHRAGEPVLDIAPQRLVHGQPGGLRAPGPPAGVPLGRAGPVLQAAAAGRGIAPQLPGNRRCRPTQLARDLADTDAPRIQDSDLLALAKRQISARYRGQADRPDPAAVAEPPRTDRWGHTSLNAGVLTRHSLGDRQPEPLPLLPPRHRRPARRPHRPPACSVQPTPLLLSHRNPSQSRRCDDQLNPPSTPRPWSARPAPG